MEKKIQIPKAAEEIISSGLPIFRIKQKLNRQGIPNIIGLSEMPKRYMWGFKDVKAAAKLLGVQI